MDLTKEMIGQKSSPYEFTVESRHARQFRQAIGDDNPIYSDPAYAEESAYGEMILPLTFPVAMSGEGVDFPIELDYKRMLHGEQEFIYQQPIRVGDTLTCQMKVHDIYEKEGKKGKMQFLVLDTEVHNTEKELVCISRMNIIYR